LHKHLIHQERLPFPQEKRRWQLLLKELALVEAVEAAVVLTVTRQAAAVARVAQAALEEQPQIFQSLLDKHTL
jgi:hypothetical protein